MTNSPFEGPTHSFAEPCNCLSCTAGPRFPIHVDLFSGEFFESVEDLRISGRGLDFIWARKYRSRFGPNTSQGNRWDFSYNIRIRSLSNDQLKLFNGDGREELFKRQSDGTFMRDESFVAGRQNSDGTFTFTFPDNGTWNLSALDGRPEQGTISSIVDRNGNRLSFRYDSNGRLIGIIDTLLRHIRVAYNAEGFIESLTDFTGRRITYAYYRDGAPGGSFGDLTSVTHPAVVGTPNGNDFPKGKTTIYTYSQGFADERLNHQLLTITDPKDSTYIKNTYSDDKEVEKFDFARLRRQVWGGERDIIDIVYLQQTPTPLNNQAVLMAIVNDRNRNVKECLYDKNNHCVTVREYTGRSPLKVPTTATTNRPIQPLRGTDPKFFEVRYEWNSDSQLTRIVHPNGNITEREYEGNVNPNGERRFRGNLRTLRILPGPLAGDQTSIVQRFEYQPGFGCSCGDSFVSKVTDPHGNMTLRRYDNRGNLLRVQYGNASIVEEFQYNEFGQPTRYVHPENGSGHRRVDIYTYYTNADGPQNGYLKEEITDANNLALTTAYQYDAVGNITLITDPGGHDSLYIWNQLDQVVRELSPKVNAQGDRYQVDIFYDANDNKTRTAVQNREEQGVVPSLTNFTTTWEYDILNHCIRVSKEVGPNHKVVTEFSYDGNRNRTLTRYGEATNGNQPANAVSEVYDERDLLFQKIKAPNSALQSTTQYDYDPGRNRVRTRMGLEDKPREYRSVYDGYGRVVRMTDPRGSLMQYHYDPNGNVVAYQMTGQMKDVSGVTTPLRLFQASSRFDEMDRLVASETEYFDTGTQVPIGKGKSVFQIEYSANSQVKRTIDDNGHEVRTIYDTVNRKRDSIDHKGNSVSYSYDRSSNIVRITEVEKSDTSKLEQQFVTTLAYDNLGRLTNIVNNTGNTHQYAYDSRGNRTLLIDALGNKTRLEYDGLKRVISVTRFLTDKVMEDGKPSGTIKTAFLWDDSSRLASRVDPNGNVTKYLYDPLNRQVLVTYADGTTESCSYDVHNNLLVRKQPNGNVVTTSYDLLNRPISKSSNTAAGVSKAVTLERYAYDPLSRLISAQNDHSVLTRRYDSLSHVTHEELNGQAVTAVYDSTGNKLRCTYPSGRNIIFRYDELNRTTSIADEQGTIASYRYIGMLRTERQETTGASVGFITNYVYDKVKRLIATTRVSPTGGSAINDQEYAWDPMSNKTGRSDLQNNVLLLSRKYRYDSAYRLRHTSVSDGTTQQIRETDYVLDPAGNRLRVTDTSQGQGTYTMSATPPAPSDEAVNQYTSTPFDRRRYDENGNLISISDSSGNTRSMVYDYRNQIVQYTDPGAGISIRYLYDALGRRIARKITHKDQERITHYFYHDSEIVEERDGDGHTLATYVYGNQQNGILNMRRGNQDFYYHTDDLGSIVAITDRTGKLVERYDYQDFGEPSIFDAQGKSIQRSSVDNPYLYTGQRYDPEMGFYHFQARCLDPKAGRFTTRDPIGIWEDGGNLGNGYTYAHNNPQTFVDPSGKSTVRTIPCGGPWPGPRQVKIEYEGCGSSRRQGLDVPVCRAFRASGRAFSEVQDLWLSDFTGITTIITPSGANPETTRSRVKKWFGGPDNATSTTSKQIISGSLSFVFDAFKENDVDIDCESGCDPNVNAYVNWGGYDVNLCGNFFNSGFSNSKKAAILLHELTHAYADTDDNFYYPNDGSNLPWNLLFETPTLRENADSYEQFVLEFYM